MKKIVVFTTPTSATGSLWRIVKSLAPANLASYEFIDECLKKGMSFDDIKHCALPDSGVFLFNQPHLLNLNQDFSDTLFVINFRDPRDMACNQYHWVFSHPNNTMSPEQLNARRAMVKEAGIDKFVSKVNNKVLFENHFKIIERENLICSAVIVSYAQLCLQIEDVVRRLASAFNFTDQNLIENIIQAEHPSNIGKNHRWIGNKWEGADLFPGRARIELHPDTFKEISLFYKKELSLLRTLDKQELSFFYSDS